VCCHMTAGLIEEVCGLELPKPKHM
jgi:hypothetical protein